MAVLALKPGIIYGPIQSRRLGRSLGINLLPSRYKACSFDCIYCHFGRTQVKTRSPKAEDLPAGEEVLQAVEAAIRAHPNIDALTFSGNGEPTLHPHFAAIAAGVRALRDRFRPEVKLAILSNSTTAHVPAVRQALALLDFSILKLDAGDMGTFTSINRPAEEIRLEEIIAGLKGLPNLTIQSVLVDGRVSNVRESAFEAWLSALDQIRPNIVQIYSTDRPVAEAGVEKVAPETLQRLAAESQIRTGLRVQAYWAER